ncbi:P-loop containing nucleoside triphosphate hydrolase protein [Aspergillus heteromorphus CBS 117.55]|uniref:Signal recognition particle receptor subunit beta n=1 Tax=Aspergillus heteromorphus CBS 117.55 TaxID=1448321 RepID=A0A317URN4_9EURO|nr:P-loop containing nucleoside triphosphate hydrolase protein [Aspergillus heteromorphus CBS 117.55]PWY63896.1 P-loop containing nucleoside triphosphate hydrolase protein [Aspergillus heteromorphus CBS 117.55]
MRSQGDWSSFEGIVTGLLDGNPIAIAVAVFIAFGLPVLLHLIFYRAVASPPSSNFLLLGPGGAGKTALLTLLEAKTSLTRKDSRLTHTSQTSTVAIVNLPASISTASNRYRSVNDSSLQDISKNPVKYRLTDTPGHGKLRGSQGLTTLLSMSTTNDVKSRLRAVLFMVDTAALSETETLRDTASYLHDVLLILQNRALKKGKSPMKTASEIPVLVAANKQDLFTALPPASVREKLETEIDRIRKSRSKGLMEASVDAGVDEDEEDMLGSNDARHSFSFGSLEKDIGLVVDVVGGAVKGDEKGNFESGVRKWEEWIGQCL